MKRSKLIILPLSFILSACTGLELSSNCFKSSGEKISQEIYPADFHSISIGEGIELIIQQTAERHIVLEGGKNLVDLVDFKVLDDNLLIESQNNCTALQNYHPVKVYVNTPELKKIYSSSQYRISSIDTLRFPVLELESGMDKETASANFELIVDNEKLVIQDNVGSAFKIQGHVQELNVMFWKYNGRFDGSQLSAEEVHFYHRGTNDMIFYPIKSIEGKLLNTGNVILKNIPPVIEIEQFNAGKVIYDN